MIDFHKLKIQLQCLTVFRGLLSDPVVQRFLELADRLGDERPQTCAAPLKELAEKKSDAEEAAAEAAAAYAGFVSALYGVSDNLSEYVRDLILADENPYILKSCVRDMSGSPMKESLLNDLSALQGLCSLRPQDVRAEAEEKFRVCPASGEAENDARKARVKELFCSGWNTADFDLRSMYEERIARLSTDGYGIFAQYHTFMINEGQIVPVKYPDAQTLSQLSDYEREREQVIKNTLALLAGEPASNVLLYGDAGTGKSSTIKAVANEYRDRGLRLIEVKKNQLYQIPELLETISRNPLKFILFIDDLSFSSNDNDFAALKAILEGSVAGKSGNLVVYATSNRRHLVKETMSGREGDEVHLNDTMQELMSLSARFGLVITYQKPGKDVYLNIVRNLAKEYGVEQEEDKLFQKAEAFAIRSGGRSPRVAKQFIELVRADIR